MNKNLQYKTVPPVHPAVNVSVMNLTSVTFCVTGTGVS